MLKKLITTIAVALMPTLAVAQPICAPIQDIRKVIEENNEVHLITLENSVRVSDGVSMVGVAHIWVDIQDGSWTWTAQNNMESCVLSWGFKLDFMNPNGIVELQEDRYGNNILISVNQQDNTWTVLVVTPSGNEPIFEGDSFSYQLLEDGSDL